MDDFYKILKTFLWKNYLFLRFNWISLIFVIFSSVLICWAYLGITSDLLESRGVTSELSDPNFMQGFGGILLYAPKTNLSDQLMQNVRKDMNLNQEPKGYEKIKDMLYAMENSCEFYCLGVELQNFSDPKNAKIKTFKYALSSTYMKLSPKKRYITDDEDLINGGNDEYADSGFLSLQSVIDRNYIRMLTQEDQFELEMGFLPYKTISYFDGERDIMFGSIFALFVSIIVLTTVVIPIVEEKQDGLKEFLVLATPYYFLNGVTFYLTRCFIYLILLMPIILLVYLYNVFRFIPLVYIIMLFILYLLSATFYGFVLTVLFNRVFYAKIGGFFLTAMPFIFFIMEGLPSAFSSFFFCTKCFLDGVQIFNIFSFKHRNFGFEELFINVTDSTLKMSSIYLMLIFQCIFYCALFNYLSAVFPGPGGLKKPYLFFLKKSYYTKKEPNEYVTSYGEAELDVAIVIQDLVKTFYTPTRIIKIADHLNLEIKNKQITCLLGHNGAGKTTTLNMIIGAVEKDSGKILVCADHDVSSYRHLIGFCPQHSVFMNFMTCFQHLEFFAQLRGLNGIEASNMARNLLRQLHLSEKGNEFGKKLSGGMKRRLSLGIAITGDTKVIILDEPSSGLDIESRRELWDILLELRKEKAILVTTHHMEEAEVLGDMICILANGRLLRSGSPLDLKKKDGSGYILKLKTDIEKFNDVETINFIVETIPNASIKNLIPPTVLISLPYESKEKYSELLHRLENNQEDLGIQSISLSDSSLEDVFLNSAAEVDQVDSPAPSQIDKLSIPYERLEKNVISFPKQFLAVFYKKFIYLWNERIFVLIVILLPFLCTGLSILLMQSMHSESKGNLLNLNVQQIKGVLYLKNSNIEDDYAKDIEAALRQRIKDVDIKLEELMISEESSLSKELIRIQEINVAYFLQNAIGAIEMLPSKDKKIKFNLYYSQNILHSSVILLNLINNVILDVESNQEFNIETAYDPIRSKVNDVDISVLTWYAVIFPVGLFFYMFIYITLPFTENRSNFKDLQAMPCIIYWFSLFMFDFTLHLFVCGMLGVFHIVIMPEYLYSYNEIYLIVKTSIYYGLSYLPILYCMAHIFSSISTLSTYLLSTFLFSVILPIITSGSITSLKKNSIKIAVLSFLPDFNLSHQLRLINMNFFIRRHGRIEELMNTQIFFIYAVVVFLVTWVFFILCWENKKIRQKLKHPLESLGCRKINNLGIETSVNLHEESLVLQEKMTVDNIKKNNFDDQYPLVVHELCKLYGKKIAVRGLNFAVRKQECFGLLGVNGAGKTSTFQMLTASSIISHGSIKMGGVDIEKNENEYKYLFGYCPQNDCLNNFMTAYQKLKYMAMLRGVKHSNIDSEVMAWLTQMDLLKYKNVCIRYYSGGTKRKLSAAVAMIGSPSIIFLDEPTTGVDPVSRRFLWKCMQDFQKRGKTVVLTSHSMEECEQLCNRLAIMSEGEIKCIGHVADLKQLYGTGFTISVKSILPDTEENIKFITMKFNSYFPESLLRENHAGILTYVIKCRGQCQWSSVFNKMENLIAESRDLIEDYSVNETKLEDIFLSFQPKTNIV